MWYNKGMIEREEEKMRGKMKVWQDGTEYEVERTERDRWIVSKVLRKRYEEGECPVWDIVGVYRSYEDAVKAVREGHL